MPYDLEVSCDSDELVMPTIEELSPSTDTLVKEEYDPDHHVTINHSPVPSSFIADLSLTLSERGYSTSDFNLAMSSSDPAMSSSEISSLTSDTDPCSSDDGGFTDYQDTST